MWFREPNLSLALVNAAYVRAVEAKSAVTVIDGGIELCETVAGVSAAEAADAARDAGAAQVRTIPVTIEGERRIMRVVDVPLTPQGGRVIGVAGYAIDIQELESERGAHRRFVDTQRELLDRLSAAVAQFGPDQGLSFANLPFRRLFALEADDVSEARPFARLLDAWREGGRTPEVRDYPQWRQAHVDWFAQAGASEEDWLLRDGTHLHVVAQPTPDGGLLLIAEDKTEQVQLAGARDTLLRVRTATFDNLFEAIAVFCARWAAASVESAVPPPVGRRRGSAGGASARRCADGRARRPAGQAEPDQHRPGSDPRRDARAATAGRRNPFCRRAPFRFRIDPAARWQCAADHARHHRQPADGGRAA